MIFSGLFLVQYDYTYNVKYIQFALFVIVTICFLVDLVLYLFAFGFSQTLKNWEYIIELVLQVVSWILPVCFVIRSI